MVIKWIYFFVITCRYLAHKDYVFRRAPSKACISKAKCVVFLSRRIHEFHPNVICISVNIQNQASIPPLFPYSDYFINASLRQTLWLSFLFLFSNQKIIVSRWIVTVRIIQQMDCISRICKSSVAEVHNFRGSCIDHHTFSANTLHMHWDMSIRIVSLIAKVWIFTPVVQCR